MEPLAAGDVVLVPFPFSDLSQAKLRPAVVLATVGRDDYILCQITSNPYADPLAVELPSDAFAVGSLRRTSYARPGKLFTANVSLFRGRVGRLNAKVLRQVLEQVTSVLQPERP